MLRRALLTAAALSAPTAWAVVFDCTGSSVVPASIQGTSVDPMGVSITISGNAMYQIFRDSGMYAAYCVTQVAGNDADGYTMWDAYSGINTTCVYAKNTGGTLSMNVRLGNGCGPTAPTNDYLNFGSPPVLPGCAVTSTVPAALLGTEPSPALSLQVDDSSIAVVYYSGSFATVNCVYGATARTDGSGIYEVYYGPSADQQTGCGWYLPLTGVLQYKNGQASLTCPLDFSDPNNATGFAYVNPPSPTPTPSATSTASSTSTPSGSATHSTGLSASATGTTSGTGTPSGTPAATVTSSVTSSPTPTASNTASASSSPVITPTASVSASRVSGAGAAAAGLVASLLAAGAVAALVTAAL